MGRTGASGNESAAVSTGRGRGALGSGRPRDQAVLTFSPDSTCVAFGFASSRPALPRVIAHICHNFSRASQWH